VVVIDLENPNRDMLENIFQLSWALKRPIAMSVDHSDTASIEAAVAAGVSTYVVDGLKKERIKPDGRAVSNDRLQRAATPNRGQWPFCSHQLNS